MKAIKTLSIFALSAVLAVGCTACGKTPENPDGDHDSESRYETPVVNTYDNKSYNEYLLGEDAAIKN